MKVRKAGFAGNHKRVYRLYRQHQLQMRRRRLRKLRYARGPVQLAAARPNDVWSLDFVHDQVRWGRRFPVRTIFAECSRY